MIQWAEVVMGVRDGASGTARSRGSLVLRLTLAARGQSGVRLLRTAARRARLAFRQATREEKAVLLGLAVVLAVLSWP